MSAPDPVEAIAWLASGAAFGGVYLWLIARTVKAITRPDSRMSAVLYFALRFALAAALLWLAASHGAHALLLTLLGFLLARSIIIRRFRQADDGN